MTFLQRQIQERFCMCNPTFFLYGAKILYQLDGFFEECHRNELASRHACSSRKGFMPGWMYLRSLNSGENLEISEGLHHRCFDEIGMMLEAGNIMHHLKHGWIYYLPEQ